MANIESVKKFSAGVAKVSSALAKVMEDGEVTLRDMVHVPAMFAGLKEFSGVDFSALLPEMKDLDEKEKQELAADFAAKFDLPSDNIEAVIEQGYALILAALDALAAFIKIGQKAKAA